MTSAVNKPRVIRSDEQSLAFLAGGLVMALLLIVPWLNGDSGAPFGLSGVVLIVLAIRGAIAGVFLYPDKVRIVNLANRISLTWDEIDRFQMKGSGIRWPDGAVRLRDGRLLTIFAIAGPNPLTRPQDRSAERLIDELNRELDRHTSVPVAGTRP